MKLYHGTTVKKAALLYTRGSSNPLYVTAYKPLAIMYAIITAKEEKGVPAVVILRTHRHLEKDPEHAPIPSDRAYVVSELSPTEVVTVQSELSWLLRLTEYELTNIIDEDAL